jgi:hypothetical protein
VRIASAALFAGGASNASVSSDEALKNAKDNERFVAGKCLSYSLTEVLGIYLSSDEWINKSIVENVWEQVANILKKAR